MVLAELLAELLNLIGMKGAATGALATIVVGGYHFRHAIAVMSRLKLVAWAAFGVLATLMLLRATGVIPTFNLDPIWRGLGAAVGAIRGWL